MPEGDTIWRTARALAAALAGEAVVRFESALPQVEARAREIALVGRLVERVEARGKHLLVHFAGGAVLHTHLGMHGGWSLRRPAPGARGGPARVRLDTARASAVCHGAPVVELLTEPELRRHSRLARLGPDLLHPHFDAAQARQRLRDRGEIEIGTALLTQSALAGIGNVYKSEVLFLCGVAPQVPVARLDDETLDRLIALARQLLLRNLGPGPRRTTATLAGGPLHVYHRGGEPCRRCGTTIRRIVQGEAARSTYFCPRCQPSPA